jgi:hypothetical protein
VTWTPACMDADEYAGWLEMNQATATARAVAVDRPCADCTLGYAAEMRAVGRCNGTPAGVVEEEDMEQPEPVDVRLVGRVPVTITPPPCGSCVHEPVCALRRSLEAIAEIPAAAPAVPAGLRLTLSAAVECDHFLLDRAKQAPSRKPWEISEATRAKMRASAIAARARKAEEQAGA